MIALIRKELRELGLAAVALVVVALLIALTELLYCRYDAQYKGQGTALSVWLVISVVLAFLGGAAAVAREGRARQVFLSEWPIGRLRLWVVKAAVSFLLTMAVIAVGFGVCLAALVYEGGKLPTDLADAAQGLSLFLPLCFSFGLLWSGLIGSVLGAAALGLVTCAAVFGGSAAFFVLYVPWRWGPWVGSIGASDKETHSLTLALLAMTLVAGAWAFARYPILETKRRVRWAMGTLGGMVALGCVAFVGWAVLAHRPSLSHAVVKNTGLTEDGKLLWFTTDHGGGTDSGGLWTVPVAGGKPRLVCRAGGAEVSETEGGLVLQWRLPVLANWALNGTTGRLRRLHGEPLAATPDGRYWATIEVRRGGIFIRDERGRLVKQVPNNGEVAFSPDGLTAYYHVYQFDGERSNGRVMALDLQTRRETEVLRTGKMIAFPLAVSLEERTLATTLREPKATIRQTLLVDVRTRRQTAIPDTFFYRWPFVTERYLWGRVRDRDSETKTIGVAIIDVQAQRVVRTIPASVLGGMPLAPWHREGVPYAVFPSAVQTTGPGKLWLARPDGSGLRLLREEHRQVLGMTPEGKLILWDRPAVEQPWLAMSQDRRLGRTFVSWDPVTGEEKVVVRLP